MLKLSTVNIFEIYRKIQLFKYLRGEIEYLIYFRMTGLYPDGVVD